MKRTVRSFLFITMLLVQASNAWACPMCKLALETDDAQPQAYMISILFMMGTISTLFAAVAGLLWWVSKHEKMAMSAAGYQHLFENAGSQPFASEATSNR